MKLVEQTCPNCGAALEFPEGSSQTKCPYCGSAVMIDDEAKHIRLDGTERAGYEFEKGRMRAQEEAKEAKERAKALAKEEQEKERLARQQAEALAREKEQKERLEQEKARIQAQKEQREARLAQDLAYYQSQFEQKQEKSRKKNLIWWVLGWIIIFPVPLTILIAKTDKMKTVWKVVIIVALWALILVAGALTQNPSGAVS